MNAVNNNPIFTGTSRENKNEKYRKEIKDLTILLIKCSINNTNFSKLAISNNNNNNLMNENEEDNDDIDISSMFSNLGFSFEDLEKGFDEYQPTMPLRYSTSNVDAVNPEYAYPTDSGFDLYSTEEITIESFGTFIPNLLAKILTFLHNYF